MAKKKKKGLSKRFGARYGSTIRKRVEEIETLTKESKKCPYCAAPKVQRKAIGIWKCKKCKTKFTGKAYSFEQKKAKE
ncbi:MAG: 50S ribosomal protein L37Ae [Candidatus Woesearchaeota archaeon]|nr:50S ribosomal protein L37Ae [Candidatus Woesearchaeota archaeon]